MMKHSQETKDEAVRLYQAGHSVQEIKETLGIRSDQSVYRFLEEHGITPERKGASKKGAHRISVMLSPEAARILKEAAPRNVSAWISQQIVRAAMQEKE